jgi:DNA repair protein RadC
MATAKKKINVAEIAKLAKKIRKDGERWTDAIKRASASIKSGK